MQTQSFRAAAENLRHPARAAVRALLVCCLLTTVAAARTGPSDSETRTPWLDTSERQRVVTAHQRAFSATVPPIDWDGDHGRCDAGSNSSAYRLATIERVNYYRAMAGVAATVEVDRGFSLKAQGAAIMMSNEGELTHSPGTDFACYTDVGREAAANSNLYLGRTGPAAVDGYIEDPGDHNIDVGHRSTLLHPPTRRMGVGDVEASDGSPAANALWVFDDRVFDESPSADRAPMREADRFVAWPPRGYVPRDLVHPRWSFTRAGVDLSSAEVTMFDPSAPVGERRTPLRVIERTGAPGHVPLPTLVWEPEIDPSPDVDTDYVVLITGVTEADGVDADPGIRSAYIYTVRILGSAPSGSLTAAEFLGGVAPA